MEKELRPFWAKFFDFNWKFGLFLVLLVCIPRFILVLEANKSANYSSIGLIMVISAMAPFLFLSRYGRKKIGIARSDKYKLLLLAFITGLIASFVLYVVGVVLFGHSYANWYVYIGRSYNIPVAIKDNDKAILFTVMALTGMIFSPVGDELFFRGIVHSAFSKSLGDKKASAADSSAFALTHISHFGLVFTGSEWKFLFLPTLLWVLGMFGVSLLFFIFTKKAGSITSAIICHAAFNLGMIYCIFYLL